VAPGLKVDGQPAAVQSVVAAKLDERSLVVVVAGQPVACDRLREMRGDPLPGELLRLTLTQALQREGIPQWRVATALFDGGVHTGLTNAATVTLGAAKVRALFELSVRGAAAPGEDHRTLEHDGTLVARLCPPPSTGEPPPWKGPRFTVAREQLAIRGASLVRHDDELQLWLATDPHACGVSPVGSDLALRLTLEPETFHIKETMLRGTLLASQLTGRAQDAEELRVTISEAAKKTAKVTLAGAFQVVGYPVSIDTTVQARTCSE
jgi:hypothetical protein